jgi:hypothetical protein
MMENVQNWEFVLTQHTYTSPDLQYMSPIFTPHTDFSSGGTTSVDTLAVTAGANTLTKTTVTPNNVGNKFIVGA